MTLNTEMGKSLNRLFDTSLVLRDVADGAETSTASETGIAFDCRKVREYSAVIFVTARDFTTTDETYVLTIQVSDLVGGTYTTIATVAVTATGVYTVPLNGPLAQKIDSDADFIRVTATLAGTTPSITYGCYLTKV